MCKIRSLLFLVIATATLSRGAAAVPITYGFVGTADLLTPYDPYRVLVLPIEPGVTTVAGTFTIDSSAVDGDASIARASYAFAGISALVVTLGDYYRFSSDLIAVALNDDRSTAVPEWGLIDSLDVVATSGFDPVILPDFGYAVRTEFIGITVRDIGEDAITLTDALAPLPDLARFGPPDAVGQLLISGCGLRGVVGGSCAGTHAFRITASIDDIFFVPEPATFSLVAFGTAALAASRRRRQA